MSAILGNNGGHMQNDFFMSVSFVFWLIVTFCLDRSIIILQNRIFFIKKCLLFHVTTDGISVVYVTTHL